MKEKRAALVCSGGGALGAAELGVLSELEKDGRTYEFFAGVSVGAIICSLKAFGLSTQEVIDFAFDTDFLEITFDFTINNYGVLHGKKFSQALRKILKNTRIEELKYPLFIGSTDFSTGERIIITEGDIVEALRASCCVPVLFKPFYHKEQDRWLVDGGLTQNFPLDIAIEKYKGNMITGIDVSGAIGNEIDFTKEDFFKKTKDLQNIMTRTFRIIFLSQQNHFLQDDRVEIFKPNVGNLQAINVRNKNLQALYACGKACVSETLI